MASRRRNACTRSYRAYRSQPSREGKKVSGYNELKSIVVTPVAPMQPVYVYVWRYTRHIVDTHHAIWACDDRQIGRSMITDGRERRTERLARGWRRRTSLRKSDRGGWRDGGGVVSKIRGIEVSLSLSFTLPLSVSCFDGRRGKEMERVGRRNHQVDLGWTTIEVARSLKPLHLWTCVESTCPLPIRRDWISERDPRLG